MRMALEGLEGVLQQLLLVQVLLEEVLLEDQVHHLRRRFHLDLLQHWRLERQLVHLLAELDCRLEQPDLVEQRLVPLERFALQ